jgi:hypothetical protein
MLFEGFPGIATALTRPVWPGDLCHQHRYLSRCCGNLSGPDHPEEMLAEEMLAEEMLASCWFRLVSA